MTHWLNEWNWMSTMQKHWNTTVAQNNHRQKLRFFFGNSVATCQVPWCILSLLFFQNYFEHTFILSVCALKKLQMIIAFFIIKIWQQHCSVFLSFQSLSEHEELINSNSETGKFFRSRHVCRSVNVECWSLSALFVFGLVFALLLDYFTQWSELLNGRTTATQLPLPPLLLNWSNKFRLKLIELSLITTTESLISLFSQLSLDFQQCWKERNKKLLTIVISSSRNKKRIR